MECEAQASACPPLSSTVRRMNRITRIVLASACVAATLAQAVLAWAWTEPNARKQIVRFFRDIYGGMPGWTALMLGFGKAVWLLPVFSAVLIALALWRKPRISLPVVAILVLTVLAGMLYAMYPIDLMMKGGVI
jgi:hypothetical protein